MCSDHICDETKLKVRIRRKEHLCFFDLLARSSRNTEHVDSVDDVLLSKGNCIPAALLDSVAGKEAKLDELRDNNKQSNVQVSVRDARTYRSVQTNYGVRLLPSQGYRVTRPGEYLVHAECDGKPHCVRVVRVDDTVVVCNGRARHTIDAKDAAACSAEAIDGQSIVTFEVFQSGQEPKWPTEPPMDVLLELLDLQAGTGDIDDGNRLDDDLVVSVECTGVDDEAGARGTEDYEDEDETVIYVGDVLLRELCAEVKATINMVRKRAYVPAGGSFRCPLCPFRDFGSRKGRLLDHLTKYHRERTQYVCSGTKQMKVITALYDNDRFVRCPSSTRYLARSADTIRATVRPPLSGSKNEID